MDTMSLVQRFGKPYIFLKITCNSNWPKIKEKLGENDLAQDRPDLISRIFRAKIEELKHDLIIKNKNYKKKNLWHRCSLCLSNRIPKTRHATRSFLAPFANKLKVC